MGIFGAGKPNIEKMWKKDDIEGLAKALRSENPEVRRSANNKIHLIALGGSVKNRFNQEIRKKACMVLADAIRDPIDARLTVDAMKTLIGLQNTGELPSVLRKPVAILAKAFQKK